MSQSNVRFDAVCKSFARRNESPLLVLDHVSLDVHPGELLVLVGASGCGKSTLLRILAGLESFDSGSVQVDGQQIAGPGADRAMVFQHYSLYPWLTVKENIRFSRQLRVVRDGLTSNDVEIASGRSDALLQLMGLTHAADYYPNQLSGGMQQRVAIARALMNRPRLLLMDEPFGALDAQTREVMHDLIRHVHQLEGTTIVFVTHDVEEALYLGDRVVVMAPRPGRIDSVVDVPFGRMRDQELKATPEFLAVKRQILHRIRETSGMKTDIEQLEQLSKHLESSNAAAALTQGDTA
ncbi:ABC transporter ATP-binding protein [Thiomonas intermedia]|uniref:ABC transporter ATP-binding protein n=1 Tax=Thiomonas intermedia TaxID=926 RepID=UPI0009A48AEC|nr:ABC transporter ATP-binding protein [Thiomonas intermedia]